MKAISPLAVGVSPPVMEEVSYPAVATVISPIILEARPQIFLEISM
jgi:hypothetical protein